jgi:hypothetical protein
MNAVKVELRVDGVEALPIRGTVLHPFRPEQSTFGSQHRPLGIIQPLPAPARRPATAQKPARPDSELALNSRRMPIESTQKEEKYNRKPIPDELKSPFIYIQKLVSKRHNFKHPDKFISASCKTSKRRTKQTKEELRIPEGESLYDLTLKKEETAFYLFEKIKKTI